MYFTWRVSDWWRHLWEYLDRNATNYFVYDERPQSDPPTPQSSCISIKPKYLPNAECPRGGAHWTPLRNLLFEFTDYGLQGTSLAAQGLHLRTQVGNF